LTGSAALPMLLWPLVLYFFVVLVLVAGILLVSYFLGERTRKTRATTEIFESGIVPIGEARFRFPAKFFLIAMFFVIFDLETVFLFAWAVAIREVGWAGYIEVLVFIGILVAALIYLWRVGALEWGPRGHRMRPLQELE
jgi:NADH-quinone oxidoreductase subunit A